MVPPSAVLAALPAARARPDSGPSFSIPDSMVTAEVTAGSMAAMAEGMAGAVVRTAAVAVVMEVTSLTPP
jgi:hypothetical protein